MARLERVLGCTACSRSLAVDPKSGLVAYPAGSALVLLNPRTQCRAQLLSPGQSQLTCLAWSPCGQFIASGEFGADPKVRVWALRQGNSGGKAETECELGWHRLGISCVSFTPDSEMLVSVGNNHDKQILVWDWRTRRRLAESRLTCQVNAMAQSESGRMFVTVGVRHVKFWYLERGSDGAVLLQGRSAILAEQRNNTFIDCCCASGQRTFALTLSRLLVEFADKRLVGLFQMGAEVPFALSPGAGLLFLGFGDGAIRALDLARMEPVLEFGRPQPLHADVAVGEESGGLMPQKAIEGPKFADVHSLVFHAPSGVLTALYSDRSVYHWLLQWPPAKGQRPLQPQRISSQLFHVGPIFDLEAGSTGTELPGDSFITAGADETVRFWCLDRVGSGTASLGQSANSMSPELRKVLFLCPEADSLTERPDKNFGGIISDTLESTTGVRCVRLSPGARHLACGRKNGNICVFDLSARGWPRLAEFEAHEGEVLCMDYGGREEAEGDGHGLLLASASRDRLVHVFDARRQYEHLLTLDEHRAPVIWLRFIQNAEEAPLLVSFGSDQQLLSRQLCPMPGGIASLPLARLQLDAVGGPGCCVAAQPTTGLLLVGCQNRVLHEFEAGTGRLVRTLDAAAQPGIRITKLCLDPSGSVAAALCSDRSVLLLDMDSGDCLAVLGLASDCVTGLAFSADCRRLLLVSYSGCISVWRLSAQLHRRMVAKWAAAGGSPQLLDRSASPPAAEDSASQGSAAGADSLLEFGSLLSLQDIASGGGNHQPLSATATNFLSAKQEDDELDSGIGGAGGEGGQLHQRFELKRVHPSEAPLQQVDEAETAAEQQQSAGTTAAAGLPPPMLSTPSGHSPVTLGRPQPPPYPGSQLQPHLQLQQQQNSRSMSNLIYSQNGQQQQPTGASVGGRRRWNIGSQQPQQQQQQQQLQQQPQQAVQQQQQFQNGTLFVGNGQQPLKPFAANGQQLNQHPLTHPPQNFQPRPLHPAQPSAQTSFVGLSPDSQQQRFGISSSVSLNAIRAKLVTADGVGAAECGQQQLSPTPAAVWSSHNPTRNSTSRRYFNGGGNGNAMEQQSWVWTPGGGGGGGLQVKSVAGGLSRRRSSLFNNSAEPGPSSFGQQQNNLLGISHASASPGSSSQTSGTGAADFRPSPESAGGGGRRLFQSAQQNAADGAGGARLALTVSRIKQRRMGGPASDAGGIANGHSEINANNNSHSQHNGNGAQAAPFSSRSRSQSPSQLAMALLAAQQGHNGQQQQQQSQQPRPKAAVSPSGRSAISSSPSSASRYQLRLSSVGSSSRLQQARQRLKKSQENLAAAIEADSFLVAAAGNDQQNEKAEMVDNGPLSRSRSIGNLQLARLAEDGGGHGGGIGGGSGSDTGIGSSPFGGRRRQMAKSVTDLVAEQKMAASSGAEQERLAECRQRLARSIRDIRRISESDLFPDAAASPAQVAVASISANRTPTGEDSVSGSLDSSWHSPGLRLPRRGVQKKLDRQWTPSNRASLGQTATAADSPAAQQSAANPLFFHSTLPRRTSIEGGGGAGPTSAPNTALRSVSSLMASSSRSPRSNYLAHKLAGQGSSSGGNSAESAGSAVGHQQLQQQSGNRSLSAELGTLATGLANGGQFGSAGAKRMALHAQECIREMQQACDKLLGTRQLIQLEPAIGAEEKRQLLASVNLAVAAFAQRLTMEEGQADQ